MKFIEVYILFGREISNRPVKEFLEWSVDIMLASHMVSTLQ